MAVMERVATYVAVCKCGEMFYTYGTLQRCADLITLNGWVYEKKRWKCGACARKERAS